MPAEITEKSATSRLIAKLEAELLAAQEQVRVLESSESIELAHEKSEKDRYAGLWVAAQEREKVYDRALNWNEPRIIPTPECPDYETALKLAREALAGSPSEKPRG